MGEGVVVVNIRFLDLDVRVVLAAAAGLRGVWFLKVRPGVGLLFVVMCVRSL